MHKKLLDFDGFHETNDDIAYRTKKDSDFYNGEITEQHEKEVNNFASRILLPKNMIVTALEGKTIDSIIKFNRYDIWSLLPIDRKWIAEHATLFNVSEIVLKLRLGYREFNSLRGDNGYFELPKTNQLSIIHLTTIHIFYKVHKPLILVHLL